MTSLLFSQRSAVKKPLLTLLGLAAGSLVFCDSHALAQDEDQILIGNTTECSRPQASKMKFCVQNMTDHEITVGFLYNATPKAKDATERAVPLVLGPSNTESAAGGPMKITGDGLSLFVVTTLGGKDFVSSTPVREGDVFWVVLAPPNPQDPAQGVDMAERTLTLVWRNYKPGEQPPSQAGQ